MRPTSHPANRHSAPTRWIVGALITVALSGPVAATEAGSSAPASGATSDGTLATSPPPDSAAPGALEAPVYQPDSVPDTLQKEFERKGYKREPKSGNYLSPKVSAKTLNEPLVPVLINGKYTKDLKGRTVFLRQSIRDRLLAADAEMFKKKQQHIVVNYGFRSNALQHELFQKLSGHGKVAPAAGSFHETGMALDLSNWRDAQRFMIEAGFVGGCYGIEEDLVHYSIGELTKASNAAAFRRCTLKEIPEHILTGLKKAGDVVAVGIFRKKKQ